MRKIVLSLITLSLIVTATLAKTHSDKTFLMPRYQLTNLPMEYTTWHRRLHKRADAQYNGSLQIVGFYQESTNKGELGDYFGFNWHHKEGQEIKNEIGVANTTLYPKILLNSRFIMHDYHNEYDPLLANYKFRPYQEVYGARFEWHQDLDKILDGLFFRVTTPLVDVRNHMDLTNLVADTKEIIPGSSPEKTNFLDFLSGKLENVADHNKQAPLKNAKINDGSHSTTGFADVELMLGYTAIQKSKTKLDLSVSMIVPTGNTPDGKYIFEPICGNGHHWGVGFGVDFDLTLWERENKSVEFMVVGKYQFLFEGTEKRTINFKWPFPGPQELASANYYLLGGEVGQAEQPLFPMANVLTRKLTVRPGSVIDAIAAFAFNIGNCTFDIGYNVFFKEEERVNLKNHWENDKYAVAATTYSTETEFHLLQGLTSAYGGAAAVDGANVAIQKENLDMDSVTTPFQVTQKVYAGLGYEWNKMRHPLFLGIGGSYEHSNKNTALSGWALWVKTGISW